MSIEDKLISEATSEELLYVLIHVNGISDAARKSVRVTPHSESLIAIGPDATASIIVDTEDLQVLEDIVYPKTNSDKSTPQQRMTTSRHALGLSQEQLAKKTGLAPAAISHFETGARKPCFDNLLKLTNALGVSADYILGTKMQ
jgi:DNA-binding XRE family transcriptional regulator